MCRFKSAIVTKTGELYHNNFLDSHEDLIDLYGLNDNGIRDNFIRIEYYPIGTERLDDIKKYELHIDENEIPEWFDDTMKNKIERKLKTIIKGMIISDNKKIIVGKSVILTGDAVINKIQNCVVLAMYENSQVNVMYDNSQVNEMYDNSQVNGMWGNSQVKEMHNNSQVKEMHNNSQVNVMWGNSQVNGMWGNSQVNVMYDNSQVNEMYENSQKPKQ